MKDLFRPIPVLKSASKRGLQQPIHMHSDAAKTVEMMRTALGLPDAAMFLVARPRKAYRRAISVDVVLIITRRGAPFN